MTDGPSIIEVAESYGLVLQRAGREYSTLCPIQPEKTASFYINAEKNLWHCFGCGAGGDVIEFIKRLHGCGFKEALVMLGIEDDHKPRQPLTAKRKAAAALAARWAAGQRAKIGNRIGESLWLRDLADEVGAFELAEIFDRELIMLRGFYDALEYPRGAAELLALRPAIEQITEGAEVAV